MGTIFSQILFLSIYSIFVPQTSSVEKLFLSYCFQKLKNYLKCNNLLCKAKIMITKIKILWNIADH